MKIIGKFIANVRNKLFTSRTTQEIHFRILPHIEGRADNGYPFSSAEGLFKARLDGFICARETLHAINHAAGKMSEAEGNAFRYIVARDLNERMRRYLEFAQSRECSSERDTQLVATAA